jgi:ATP-binding cassette subfamily C protein
MMDKLLTLLDRRQRLRISLVLLGMLVAALLEMLGIGAIPGFVALLSDPESMLSKLPDGVISSWIRDSELSVVTLYGAATLAAIFVFKNIFIAGLVYAEGRVIRDVTSGVSTRLFRAYLDCPYTFHLQRNPAELIRNVSTEVLQAVALVSNGMMLIREGLVLIVVFLLLLILDPLVSLSTFVFLGSAAAAFYFSVRRSLLKRGRLAQEHRGRQLQAVNQALGAIKDAKILGREPYLMEQFSREVKGLQHHDFYAKVAGALPRLFLEVLAVSSIVIVAAVFVLLGRTIMSILPVLALLAVGTVRLVPAFNGITASLVRIRNLYPSFELVCRELDVLEQVPESSSIRRSQREDRPGFHSTIVIDGVHYTYPGARDEALHGVSATVSAGEAIGFIGPSGAGKSTLIDVILGLLTPTAGEVTVDGKNTQLNMSAWQQRIGYIPQDIYLIDDSIRRNIAFGLPDEEIDSAAIERSLNAAQLNSFVETLPDGLETMVGNRGIRLSGGQRQRIGIARALYNNPDVLVMDEATSALDGETERAVVSAIEELQGERTIIIIAHRLSTVQGCDRIYLLESGKVIDSGKIADLAQRYEYLQQYPPTNDATVDDRKIG